VYTHTEVRTFQTVLKPLVDCGTISNEIFVVAVKALKDNITGPTSLSRPTQRERLISVKEAAVILGCCTKTIARLTERGTLRRIHYGTTSIRYKESDVLALANHYGDSEEV